MACTTWIQQCTSVCLITLSIVLCVQSDYPKLHGVSLTKASLYVSTKDFTCFDGTITIPFSYVNDDYCDCFDGSDEPGTSACLNGIFYCLNTGHKPQNLTSSKVNDGICDCCDGSDEYATAGLCSDACDELGKEAREEAARMAELHKAGRNMRQELIEKGTEIRSKSAEKLAQLEQDKIEALKIKAEKEALKNEVEAKENVALQLYREAEEQEKLINADLEKETHISEASKYFEEFDSDHDTQLSPEEISEADVFDKNRDGEVDKEEMQYFFGSSEIIDKEIFTSVTWPVLYPILVENGEAETIQIANPFSGSKLDNNYDENTQKLVDEASELRRQFIEAERYVREIESNIRNVQQSMQKDYGSQEEYATLDNQCFDYEDKEYIYKLCLFQKVTQTSKQGASDVGLGNWGEWSGDEHNKYSTMKYTNGMACWNGPSRSTVVNLKCGLETKVLSVSEPYRCEYWIELTTPAACDESKLEEHPHDEL